MKAKKEKKFEDLWSKIRNLIWSITKNSDDYNKEYMKIKFNSDDEIPLNKMIETSSMIIVARAVFMKMINNIHKVSQINVCINYRREQKAVSIYCYLIKYKGKQIHLLPFYVTNNKLIIIYYKNGKQR